MIIVESSLSDQLSKKPERMQLVSMIPEQYFFTSNSTKTCSAGRVLVMTQSPVVGETKPYCGVMKLPPVYENLTLISEYNTIENSAPFMSMYFMVPGLLAALRLIFLQGTLVPIFLELISITNFPLR